jgi:hypothetical protein
MQDPDVKRFGSGDGDGPPFFSICIPQHNRTSFLLEALRVLRDQTFTDFEVCISDDCSTDGREHEILRFFEERRLRGVYYRQPLNLRYDGNLRAALSLASGKYAILMGNDDCLAAIDTLNRLHDALVGHPNVGVVVTNFADWESGAITRRVLQTRVLPGNASTAVATFRNLAFVSGLVLKTARTQEHATARWDGSEMYQMYAAGRLLSTGLDLLEWEDVAVRKDIRIPGEMVDNYARRPRLRPCPIVERKLTLAALGRVVYDGINYGARPPATVTFRLFLQILLFTYPYWIVEYRRVQSWNYAAGLAVGMRPANVLEGVVLPLWASLSLRAVYCAVTVSGLLFPVGLFHSIYPRLHKIAKRSFRLKQRNAVLAN